MRSVRPIIWILRKVKDYLGELGQKNQFKLESNEHTPSYTFCQLSHLCTQTNTNPPERVHLGSVRRNGGPNGTDFSISFVLRLDDYNS